ncbi:MAG TPA: GntG family PLP-dependent aldolase [Pirellulales bacterium]|jgi:threonine aldolase|nr:GntG family PLP-dependent aldolase [Pirellulales bacterium]
MPTKNIDFRSDTLTKPTPAMRSAMAAAEVGDDVFNEDPTVLELQRRVADVLGKEAALFVPSGSMSNQIGVRVHCSPGDEFICEAGCHIYNFEQAAYAQLSGLAARTVEGEFGVLRLDQLTDLIRPNNEHQVRTRLVCLENTHNRGAGRIQPYDTLVDICAWAHAHGVATHLDGARLFNAVVATGIPAADWAQHFDTVSVCFSKGLGAPVGSALTGPREMIARARRHRKLFGGGMRQAGVIAAGALYALEHHIERLAEDHQHAQLLAAAIREIEGLELYPEEIDTNIVIFRVDPRLGTAADFAARLKAQGLLTLPVGSHLIRAVTHLDVSRADVEQAGIILRAVAEAGLAKA